MLSWYKKHVWITLCVSKKKIFCLYCRYVLKHNMFSPCGVKPDAAFTTRGFENIKKAIERFLAHESSAPHNEARMKWELKFRPTLVQQLSVESAKAQTQRRMGLLRQLFAMKFLLCQGLSLRGHIEKEGNLPKLLSAWSEVTDSAGLKHWTEAGKYMSHDIINELITIMGNTVLREILTKIRGLVPGWYAVIGDEATDVQYCEQFNVSIRYVDDDYTINEDPIGMFSLPDTYAETICSVIKDILLRCSIPLSLCRGQAYDGAAVMKGIRSGVSTRIRNDVPQALPVHCLAHCLNLCLQDAGKQINLLRDAIQLVREIVQLINCSPKRRHLFTEYLLAESDKPSGGLKPLCPTRWTVRAAAMEAVIMQYSVIMETLEDVHHNTRDEYGLKAGGLLAALEKFETFFSLKLGCLLFGCSENTSKVLQAKDITMQEAVKAISVTQSFYKRQRQDEAFNTFFDRVEQDSRSLNIGLPVLPRYRKPPQRFGGDTQHEFMQPREYFRQKYFEACDILIGELSDRFEQEDVMKPVLCMESILLKSACGETCTSELKSFSESVFQADFSIPQLEKQLSIYSSM